MNRGAHVVIGGCAGWAVGSFLGEPTVFAALSAVGAALPDFDQKWAPRYYYAPKAGSDCHWYEHRGPTHSLAAVGVLWLGLTLAGQSVIGCALAVGWLSHLLADSASFMGVPWLWPLSWRRLRPWPARLRIRSGSPLEWLVVAAFVVLSVGVVEVWP